MHHLRYLSVINKVSAVFDVVVLGLCGLVCIVLAIFIPGQGAAEMVIWIGTGLMLLVFGVLFGVLFWILANKIALGQWRMFQTVMAVLSMGNNPPIGIAYAIYAFWVCWVNEETKAVFERGGLDP
jgi:VIT1/CCC1 family predicted Fe2+/Mn2+ transporter